MPRVYILDQGIPKDIFLDLDSYHIYDNCDSKEYVGLQIADIIVVLLGKLDLKMNAAVQHDLDNLDRIVNISSEYYKLSKEQFYLIKKIKKFIFDRKTAYHYACDIYFDESVILESYILYIII